LHTAVNITMTKLTNCCTRDAYQYNYTMIFNSLLS